MKMVNFSFFFFTCHLYFEMCSYKNSRFPVVIGIFILPHLILLQLLIKISIASKISISPCSIRMREITDQSNSEYGHFTRSV